MALAALVGSPAAGEAPAVSVHASVAADAAAGLRAADSVVPDVQDVADWHASAELHSAGCRVVVLDVASPARDVVPSAASALRSWRSVRLADVPFPAAVGGFGVADSAWPPVLPAVADDRARPRNCHSSWTCSVREFQLPWHAVS